MPFRSGQEDQRHLPGAELGDEDEGELGPGRIAEPIDIGEPEADQELIEDALGRIHRMRKMKERAKSGMIEGR